MAAAKQPVPYQDAECQNKACFAALVAAQKLAVRLEEIGLHGEAALLDPIKRTVTKKYKASRFDLVNATLVVFKREPFGPPSAPTSAEDLIAAIQQIK